MGRRKKLAEIDRLEGNPGRRFIEETGIEALGSPFIPEHLSDDARGCIEVIQANMPPNIYSALDSFILSAFATAWAIHKKATLVLAIRTSFGSTRASAAPGLKAHGSGLPGSRQL